MRYRRANVSALLEIVEGPDAGRQIPLREAVVVGRDAADADVTLDDGQISRRHARIEPAADGAVVEDLGSTNGTFVNQQPVAGRAPLRPGDELVLGVTVLQLHTGAQVTAQASAVRAVPPALARAETPPQYAKHPATIADPNGIRSLERLVDARVKGKARIAPLPVFVLAALVVIVYLGLS